MRKFAESDTEQTLYVLVTGKDHHVGVTWAKGAAAVVANQPYTETALVVFSGGQSTEDDIEKAISEHEHAELCIVALDEGVPAALRYMARMSAGVTEKFVACLRDTTLYDDGAYMLLMDTADKIGNFFVVTCSQPEDGGIAEESADNVVYFEHPDDVAALGKTSTMVLTSQDEKDTPDEEKGEQED
ncbi:MAG: hypothetical protein JSS66_07595 [Armatimonadetes bacterium]|nr:hypothetical protein [Armatimonadota bacterium]